NVCVIHQSILRLPTTISFPLLDGRMDLAGGARNETALPVKGSARYQGQSPRPGAWRRPIAMPATNFLRKWSIVFLFLAPLVTTSCGSIETPTQPTPNPQPTPTPTPAPTPTPT